MVTKRRKKEDNSMSDKPTETAVVKKERAEVEYVPYGGQDKIKLHIGLVQNLIAVKTKSGKTCSDQEAIKFIAMCQAKRLNPFEGDAYLIGYDGKDGPSFSLITAHQTYLKRAELHPEFDGMKSGVIIKEGDIMRDLEGDFYVGGQQVIGGWATVFFKTRKYPMHKRIRLERFKKPFGIWVDDPAGMICKCAEADALRSAFPTMLGGLYMKEEYEATALKASKPDFSVKPALFVAPPAPETETAPSQSLLIEEVRKMCTEHALSTTDLLAFLNEIGVEDAPTFEQLTEKTLVMVKEQFDDILSRIQNQQGGE